MQSSHPTDTGHQQNDVTYTGGIASEQPAQQSFQQPLAQPPQQPPRQLFQRSIPQPLDYLQPTQITSDFVDLIEKVPFEHRANPLIDKDHPDFLQTENYFSTLLRNTNFTIQFILESIFEAHEIRLFEPAVSPPQLAELQKSNSIRYQKILETRFKGHVPSLQLKLAFLYFGLPVAPMRPGADQTYERPDLDLGEHNIFVNADPFVFLDGYAERSYGNPLNRVTISETPSVMPTQEFSSLRLRGGALPGKMEWEAGTGGAFNQASYPVRIYGYQGSVLSDSAKRPYESFIAAVDQLLGVKYEYNYSICLQIWDQSSSSTQAVEEVTGMIYRKGLKSPDTDPIYLLVQRLFGDSSVSQKYCAFVHFDKEPHPQFYQPAYELDRYIVRVWDDVHKNMAYMKVPQNLQLTHKPNQFSAEYLRAMRVLFPEAPHKYLQFAQGSEASTCGLFDPPPETWSQVVTDQAKLGELPLLAFNQISIPENSVPVFIPGFHAYNTQQTALLRDELRANTSEEEHRSGLSKVLKAVAASNPFAVRSLNAAGIDVWVPGEDFLDPVQDGSFVSSANSEISMQTFHDWLLLLRGFQASRIHAHPERLSMVVRPIFTTYNFHAKSDSKRQFSINLNDYSLWEFRAKVQSDLYREYQGTAKGQVLHLVQSTWSRNRTEFAIRADTDVTEWRWIVRHITEPDITVSLENWTNSWDVEKNTTWGPRYDLGNAFSLASKFEPSAKPEPFDRPMDSFFSRSINNLEGADRIERLRERLYWNDASIFTNPAKPAISVHAPPVETIIMTGPNVPGFTTAMRTPSEVARLEREVHTLRGNLLDRIRECPYVDCQRHFRFSDGKELDRHLREDHKVLQCFLCDKEEHTLQLQSSHNIRKHFLDEHYDQLKELFGAPAGPEPGATKSGYCDRCGRNQSKLNNPNDQVRHGLQCRIGPTSETTYCEECGRVRGDQRCECGQSRGDIHDVGSYCAKCGMEYDSTMNQLYREHHIMHCMLPGGQPNDFCPTCGVMLADQKEAARSRHISSCDMLPRGTASNVPDIPDIPEIGKMTDPLDFAGVAKSLLNEPKQPTNKRGKGKWAGPLSSITKSADLGQGTGVEETPQPSRKRSFHERRGPRDVPIDLPTIPEASIHTGYGAAPSEGLGDVLDALGRDSETDDKERRQRRRQQRLERIRKLRQIQQEHDQRLQQEQLRLAQQPGPTSESQGEPEGVSDTPLWREATTSDAVPPRRSHSPPWDEILEPESAPGMFDPAPDWVCSRCFRTAGTRMNEKELHMSETGSCKIRRGLGTTAFGPVPNRSGWIIPDEKFNFRKAYHDFVKRYPAYRYTMFPVRDEKVYEVWEGVWRMEAAVGSLEDDPNFDGPNHRLTRSRFLPWPPYEGTVIPFDESEYPPQLIEEVEAGDTGDAPTVEGTAVGIDNVEEPTPIEYYPGSITQGPAMTGDTDVESIVPPSEGSIEFAPAPPPRGARTRGSRSKRKRNEEYDSTFVQPVSSDDEIDEEYSEASAVPDPVQNLAPDAPPTPKKRSRSSKTGVVRSGAVSTPAAPGQTFSATIPTNVAEVNAGIRYLSDFDTPPDPPNMEWPFEDEVEYGFAEARPQIRLPPDWNRVREIVERARRGDSTKAQVDALPTSYPTEFGSGLFPTEISTTKDNPFPRRRRKITTKGWGIRQLTPPPTAKAEAWPSDYQRSISGPPTPTPTTSVTPRSRSSASVPPASATFNRRNN